MNELIYRMETAQTHEERLALLAELSEHLRRAPSARAARHLKSLLYHPDWYIRQEIAFLIDRYGVPLKAGERRQYWYALGQFELLKKEMARDAEIRALLFAGCRDASPRFRLPAHLSPADCRTATEQLLLLYAAGDYTALVEKGAEPQYRAAAVELLQFGLQPENNPPYHRKQCAFALEQLQALENAASVVQEILAEPSPAAAETAPQDPSEVAALHLPPLARFIARLQRQGIRVDGEVVYPVIRQAAATGRITYQQPGLQTWSAAERRKRLNPPPGCLWLRFDFQAMEPTLLLHFLLQRFLISLADIPEGDVYAAVHPEDRRTAKTWFNAVINGGGKAFQQMLNPWQMKLLEALRELRRELLQEVYASGGITTIAGNLLRLDPEEKNLAGKATNRLVQGSASDVFHHAVLQLDAALRQEQIAAQIGFLLFDEVWVAVAEPHAGALKPRIRQILLAVNDHFQLLCPLAVRES